MKEITVIIRQAAHSGRFGGGSITGTDLAELIRSYTGERQESAA